MQRQIIDLQLLSCCGTELVKLKSLKLAVIRRLRLPVQFEAFEGRT